MAERIVKKSAIAGLITGGVSLLICWAVFYESSPIYSDPVYPNVVRFVWQLANMPAGLALLMTRSLAFGAIVLFFQWFLIGFCVNLIYGKE